MKRRPVVLGVLLAVGLAGTGVYLLRRPAPAPTANAAAPAPRIPSTARAPGGVRIRVDVLNASTVRGLARRATMHLRDHGFDVVEAGGTNERRDSTVILDRTNHPEWAALAAKAMGGARIESRPDSLRDVDLTVLVGATWRPPPEPFYP
jgi:hypothetical protein